MRNPMASDQDMKLRIWPRYMDLNHGPPAGHARSNVITAGRAASDVTACQDECSNQLSYSRDVRGAATPIYGP